MPASVFLPTALAAMEAVAVMGAHGMTAGAVEQVVTVAQSISQGTRLSARLVIIPVEFLR